MKDVAMLAIMIAIMDKAYGIELFEMLEHVDWDIDMLEYYSVAEIDRHGYIPARNELQRMFDDACSQI